MRLKSGIWVSAFLRQNTIEGRYGAVISRGADEAGAIYVIVNHLNGTYRLFGPAPGSSYDELGERRWSEELPFPADIQQINALLERRKRSDPDIWIVEIEDRKGTAGLVATA